MCGILGTVSFAGNRPVADEQFKQFNDLLTHRGPDDAGYYFDNQIQFGFRRLSIIGLESGNQPIFNEDETLVLICNGEIFDYELIRKNLIRKGHKFRTQSDVEVLLHLYEDHGVEMLEKLNGQFAFAIFNLVKQELLLARDHFGVCPLFFTSIDGGIIFGSEIKSLIKFPQVAKRVNLKGLDQIFTFPGMVSPVTMFENIHALKPGHFLTVTCDTMVQREYWDLKYPKEIDEDKSKDESYYVEGIGELLEKSVKRRLNADVPVGLYLSGGLDSSIIAAISNLNGNQVAKRKSFSIIFDDRRYDERKYQDIISNHIDSEHYALEFKLDDIVTRLKDMIYYAETPLKETYNTCNMALSESVKKNGIKVVLTGEGADEIFAGYAGYKFDVNRDKLVSDLNTYEDFKEKEIRRSLWGDEDFQYEKNLFDFQDTKMALYSEDVNMLYDSFNCAANQVVDKTKLHGISKINKRSYLDLKLRLSDHLLADHGDRTAFANSVEARYPFLDIDLITFLQEIPSSYKVNGMTEKYLLKKFASTIVPSAITEREKFGFVAPGSSFIIKQNHEWVNDMLSYDRIKRQGYFDADTVQRLVKMYSGNQFSLHETYQTDLLMIVLTFSIFLELFEMPNYK